MKIQEPSQNVKNAIKALRRIRAQKKMALSGTIECPECGSDLHYVATADKRNIIGRCARCGLGWSN